MLRSKVKLHSNRYLMADEQITVFVRYFNMGLNMRISWETHRVVIPQFVMEIQTSRCKGGMI